MKHHPSSIVRSILALALGSLIACSPQVQTQFATQTIKEPVAASPSTILVLGSSVAAGWVTSYETRHDLRNGYAARLGRMLQAEGDTLINHSIPGNNSADILGRMDEHTTVAHPNFVLIGLSLGNERIDEDRDSAVAAYGTNLPAIVERCRGAGAVPVVGLCYPYDRYDETDYAYLKRMNLEIDGWGVPTINFLGALDDGHGHFVEGCTFDEGHPDNRGHEEMFLVIVPSLFDALRDGKSVPARPRDPGHTTVKRGKHGPAPMGYVPDDPIHPFAVGFSFRTKHPGALMAVETGGQPATVSLGDGGVITYRSSRGLDIVGSMSLADGEWHDVVVSHRYLLGMTLLFVDGRLVGETAEQIEPRRFVLGAAGGGGEAPKKADYRDWLVYRSALNADEAAYLYEGNLFAASMEVYAPLDDEKLTPGRTLENRALSTSVVVAMAGEAAGDVAALAQKIDAAQTARENEFVPEEKEVVAVDAAILEQYVGDYEIVPGDIVEVIKNGARLYILDRGERVELFAESPETFFIKTVGDITLTFVKDGGGDVVEMVLSANGQKIPAKRLK